MEIDGCGYWIDGYGISRSTWVSINWIIGGYRNKSWLRDYINIFAGLLELGISDSGNRLGLKIELWEYIPVGVRLSDFIIIGL